MHPREHTFDGYEALFRKIQNDENLFSSWTALDERRPCIMNSLLHGPVQVMLHKSFPERPPDIIQRCCVASMIPIV